MKHPHCNRSLSAHLLWCRGFAPLFFILSAALFVVAVGSGVYFMSHSVDVPADNGEVVPVSDVLMVATGTDVVVVSAQPSVTTTQAATKTNSIDPKVDSAAPSIPSKSAPAKPFDCGVGESTEACIFEHISSCTPAKGSIIDEHTGVRVEHAVDGLANGTCTYRSVITSAPNEYAILDGLDVWCSLPKDQLLRILQASTDDELLQSCTGSYIEVVRQARGIDPVVQ